MKQFYNRLKSNVKDEIIKADRITLGNIINLSLRVNNRLRERAIKEGRYYNDKKPSKRKFRER